MESVLRRKCACNGSGAVHLWDVHLKRTVESVGVSAEATAQKLHTLEYKWEIFDDGQRMMVKYLLQFHLLGLNFFRGEGGGG